MASITWHDGVWSDESRKIVGPMDHAFWMASVVFDGARAFDGLVPDLDRHCARLLTSATNLGLEPTHDASAIEALCREAVARLAPKGEHYIRPAFHATRGFVAAEPSSTELTIAVFELPLPSDLPQRLSFSNHRRPAPDMAPTDSKASCLYPNAARMLREVKARGFDNAIVFGPEGDVAELATANFWICKDGVAMTPKPTGAFLDGITKNRVASLLRSAGIEVVETKIDRAMVEQCDEAFSTGNYGKVMAATAIEDRELQPGPIFRRARDLYREWSQSQPL